MLGAEKASELVQSHPWVGAGEAAAAHHPLGWASSVSRNGNSTASLGNLCPEYVTTLTGWRFSVMLKGNFLCWCTSNTTVRETCYFQTSEECQMEEDTHPERTFVIH